MGLSGLSDVRKKNRTATKRRNKEEPQERAGKGEPKKGREKENRKRREKEKEKEKEKETEEKRGKANIHLLTQQPANGFTFHGANDMAPCGKAHAESQFAKS